MHFQTDWRPDLLGGITMIRVLTPESKNALTLVPYYAWCHRGPNEMRVWFPTGEPAKQAVLPRTTDATLAASSTISEIPGRCAFDCPTLRNPLPCLPRAPF